MDKFVVRTKRDKMLVSSPCKSPNKTSRPPRPESPYASPTSKKKILTDVDEDDEEVTFRDVPGDKEGNLKTLFIPLKPLPPSQEELAAEAERAIHFPLPTGLKTSDIYKGRKRHVQFRVVASSIKKKKLFDIFEKCRKSLGVEEVQEDTKDLNALESSSCQVTLDRANIKIEHCDTTDITLKKLPSDCSKVMNAMADITSNCVVVLGNSELEESLAREKVKEYKMYLDKKKKKADLKQK